MKNNQQISSISKNYAKALVETSKEANISDAIKKDLCNVLEVMKSSEDLTVVLENSSVSISKKIEILGEIFSDKISSQVLNLLKILTEKNRLTEIENIYNSYCEMLDNLSNKKNVTIISSIDLDESTKNNIVSRLEKKLNCEVISSWETDQSIIAGLVFKFGDYVIDTSLNTKLKNLSKNILR